MDNTSAAQVATIEQLDDMVEIEIDRPRANVNDIIDTMLDCGDRLAELMMSPDLSPDEQAHALKGMEWLKRQIAMVIPGVEASLHRWAKDELAKGHLPVVSGVGVVKPHWTADRTEVKGSKELWGRVKAAVIAAPWSQDDLVDGEINAEAGARKALRVIRELFPMDGSTIAKTLVAARCAQHEIAKGDYVKGVGGRRTVQLVTDKAAPRHLELVPDA